MDGKARPQRGGILREGFDYDFSRVDPAAGAHVDPPWCAVYETTLVYDDRWRPGPMLAEGWRTSADKMTWYLRIGAGRRFHSGDVCDAAAVAAAYRLHSDPVASPVNQFFWSPVADVSHQDDEVVIRLRHTYAGLPTLVRSWHSAIHNQATRARTGDDYGWTCADGTGPFRLKAIELGRHLDVERWNAYPGSRVGWFENKGAAYLDGIRWIPLLDEEKRATALEHGEVDCIQNPSLLHTDRLAANPDLRVIEFQQSALAYFAVDHQTTAFGFDDVRVRRAISQAIDRRAIIDHELGGHGEPAYGPIPSKSPWYAPEVESTNGYDPQRAMALLDQAGRRPGRDGIRLRFPALVLEDATLRRAARRIQDQLARIGIQLELHPIDGFAAFYGELGKHPPAFISKWLWPDPVDAIIGFIHSGSHSGPNWQRASIPAIDAATNGWRQAPDEAAQRRAATDIQQLAAEWLPLIPLYYPSAVWAHHRRVQGWRPLPSNLYPLYNDVWLEPAETA